MSTMACLLSGSSLLSPRAAVMQMCVRWKKGSPAQSQKANRPDRDYRIKFPPGTRVPERAILATQRDLDYHPGLNTILDPRNNTIFSVCEGTFYVSTEKISPDLKHEVAEKYYASRVGQHIHKRFINVIPDKPHLSFRLIDLV